MSSLQSLLQNNFSVGNRHMDDSSRFEQLVSKVPVDNDKIIGQAVGWFINQQEPENVNFTQYKNGYEITVKTNNDSAKDAKEFWENHVHPELGGNE